MHMRLGLLCSIALSLTIVPLAVPVNPVTRMILASAVAQTAEERKAEADRLLQQGVQQVQANQFQAAFQSWQDALQLYREIDDRSGEAVTLLGLGSICHLLSQYPQALEFYQQAFASYRTLGNRLGEGTTLNNIGAVYSSLGQYPQALEQYQQALGIAREIGNRRGEGTTLNGIGLVYDSLGQYPQALEQYQQALRIAREIGDRRGEGTTLNSIGLVYDSLGQYPQALEQYQQALVIAREIGNRRGEGTTLNSIGLVYDSLGQYPQALEQYQQALVIRREIGDRSGEGAILHNIGAVYDSLGQYPQALEQYQQALRIAREIGDRSGEGTTLNGIGTVYQSLGQYPQALEQYQQALMILREIGDRRVEGTTLNGIGLVYDSLGQYPQALEQYQQALRIAREIGDRRGEGATLHNIGAVYQSLGQYPQALEQYQQALMIRREIGARSGEGTTLNNIGAVYKSLGQYPQALEQFQQALVIAREIGARSGEGTTLNNIGGVYDSLGQYSQALEQYQQALVIAREIGDRRGEGGTLNNIGYVLEVQKQNELAIVFFKQSVNTLEKIRGELRVLSTEQQQSFTDTVSGTYRKLADLLFQQDRVLEAQRVIDLLKVQELEDYLQDVRGTENTVLGVPNREPEQQIKDELDTLLSNTIAISRELDQLEKVPPQQRSASQQARIVELGRQAGLLIQNFRDFLNSPAVQARVAELRNTTDGESLELTNYLDLQNSLRNLQQNAVLIYPFVLDDRLELVLVTPESATPIRKTVAIDRLNLNRTIGEYHAALKDPSSDPLPLAQQLYNWLIQPLEAELKAINAQTIIYAPDGQLRYIPLAALHDGNQWLAQRFRINNITAASLTDLTLAPSRDLQLFAGAFSEGRYEVPQGSQQFFVGLEFAGREVERLASLIPNTTKLLNRDFNPDSVYQMNSYSIVHLATHASFVPTNPNSSFIVFGDGKSATLAEVRNWRLPNVELVVLSACETGLGDALGDGREILGLGYQIQRAGARSVIASLWQVSDGGTQILMNAFYTALENGMTKAEALRQAQVALITQDLTAVGAPRGATIAVLSKETGLPITVSDNLNHPYYWAPFILIGNGL